MQAGSEMPAAMGPAVRADLRLETRVMSATRAGQPVQAANAADAAGRALVYSRS